VVVPDAAAPSEMSDAQIAQLPAALGGATNRPVQPLEARSIEELSR
jgi:carbonic anhydrase